VCDIILISHVPSHMSHSPFFLHYYLTHRHLPSFPTRRSSDLSSHRSQRARSFYGLPGCRRSLAADGETEHDHNRTSSEGSAASRSEEHTSELQSRFDLVCRLLLEKKKQKSTQHCYIYSA